MNADAEGHQLANVLVGTVSAKKIIKKLAEYEAKIKTKKSKS